MRRFYSKLLLFGEYTIIKGSSALAVPYEKYSGRWAFDGKNSFSNQVLQEWCEFLSHSDNEIGVNIDSFRKDINNGLHFDSDIPQGYGVGSSGALVAALLHEYVTKKEGIYNEKKDVFFLKNAFKILEIFFHGKGSGTDPLVCYLNQPLLFESNGGIKKIGSNFLQKNTKKQVCFLINTHLPRKTEPLVQVFSQKCQEETFDLACKKELAIYNDSAIDALIHSHNSELFESIRLISTFQYQYFQPMIPDIIKKAWENGLGSNHYQLKLCGAGGGGFTLGFSSDWKKTKTELFDFDLQVVFNL